MIRVLGARALAVAVLATVLLNGSVAPAGGKMELQSIAQDLLTEVSKLPTSDFDRRCPTPFDQGAFSRYVQAAAEGDVTEAQRRLYDLFTQLQCVSAKRFAGLQRAFTKTALQREDIGAETRQILAPVALLFFELGYGDFRAPILAWFLANADELKEADEDGESTFARIGLFARQYHRLWQLDDEHRHLLFDSLGTLEFSHGDCSLMEMLPIEDEDGNKQWMCPRGCGWDVAVELDSETDLDLNAFLAPEAQEICDEYNRARESRSRPSHAVLECGQQFAELAGDDLLICQSDAFATRGALLATFDRERTREDVYAARRCHASQPATSDAERNLRQLRQIRESIQETYRQLNDQRAEAEYQESDLLTSIAIAETSPSSTTAETSAEIERLWAALEQVRDELTSIETQQAALDPLLEALDRALVDLEGTVESEGGSSQQCVDTSTACSNACTVTDEMVQQTSACLQQALTPEEPEEDGLPPGPISRPDPRDPEEVEGALADLQECLRAAAGEDVDPETPPSTCPDYTRCPNGEVPNQEDCRCGVDQQYADVPDDCLMVAQCTDSQLVCCPRPIGPDDTRGGEGIPGVLGGDPSPVGERVRLLLSGSLAERPLSAPTRPDR